MRLFTAIAVGHEVSGKLEEMMVRLMPVARLRWSPKENLHITTKFIGEWPEERLSELCDRLPKLETAIELKVCGVRFFPNDRFPKVLFAKVEPCPALLHLAQASDAALVELGVAPDKHPYRPHVTLARIPESVYLHPLRDRLEEIDPHSFGHFSAAEYSLFRSHAGRYTPVASFRVQAAVC